MLSQQSNTASRDDTPTEHEPEQRLWPIIVLAFVVMGIGFYLALTEPPEPLPQVDEVEAPGAAVDRGALDAKAEPIVLEFRPTEPRPIVMRLSQTSRRGDDSKAPALRTLLEIEATEAITAADEGLIVERDYRGVDVEVSEDGEGVGRAITALVEELIAESEAVLRIAPNGRPLDFELGDVANPQAKRTLYLVRDAHRLLTPRFRGDAVHPGDTWSYRIPTSVEEPELGVSAEGAIAVDNELVGITAAEGRRLAVVEQAFKIAIDGRIEQEDGLHEFRVHGQGGGEVVFDVQSGHVVRSDVALKRTLKIQHTGGGPPLSQQSDIRLQLRASDP